MKKKMNPTSVPPLPTAGALLVSLSGGPARHITRIDPIRPNKTTYTLGLTRKFSLAWEQKDLQHPFTWECNFPLQLEE
jgi:hypothetical protein